MEEEKTSTAYQSGGEIPHDSDQSRSGVRVSQDDSALHYRESYPSLKRVHSHGSFSRRSFDDGDYIDARMQKLIMADNAVREEMFRECTFRPRIKGLPTQYGPLKEHGTDFIEREDKWAKKREALREQKAAVLASDLEKRCTFRPKINRNSLLAVREIRNDSMSESATERLYSNHREIIDQRERMRSEEKDRERRLDELECTFHPILETRDNPAFQHVNPKILVSAKSDEKRKQLEEKYYRGFTFTPKVNKIKPTMTSAKTYVQASVVERLTKPVTTLHPSTPRARDSQSLVVDDTPKVMDAATFLGALQTSTASTASPTQSTTAESRPKAKLAPEEFAKFMHRQSQELKKRADHKKTIERSMTPNFKPKISRKSLEIAQHVAGGNFLDRVERDVQRRQATEQENEAKAAVDTENPYKPTINKRAAKHRPRTVNEMSRGDLSRKETNRRMLKLQMEQEELTKMTFRPQISSRARDYGRSALKINENPSEFLQWTRERAQQKEMERLAILRKREEDELQQCTFAPRTSSCPAYIVRIAESMKNLKTARSSASVVSESQRPEWR